MGNWKALNKVVKHRSASLHWTEFKLPMNENTYIAFFSAGIALIGVLISALVSRYVAKTTIRTKRLELYGGFTLKLYEERLDSHAVGFELASKITQARKPQLINEQSELAEISIGLEKWSNGKGGLLMSGTTLKITRDLVDALKKQPGNGDRYTKEQADKIWSLRNDLKRSLRNDLHILTPSDTWE